MPSEVPTHAGSRIGVRNRQLFCCPAGLRMEGSYCRARTRAANQYQGQLTTTEEPADSSAEDLFVGSLRCLLRDRADLWHLVNSLTQNRFIEIDRQNPFAFTLLAQPSLPYQRRYRSTPGTGTRKQS